MTEYHGQLPLFDIDYKIEPTPYRINGCEVYEITDEIDKYIPWTQITRTDICDDCGTRCMSRQDCADARE